MADSNILCKPSLQPALGISNGNSSEIRSLVVPLLPATGWVAVSAPVAAHAPAVIVVPAGIIAPGEIDAPR